LHALLTCQLEFSLKNRFNILYLVIFVQKLWKRAKTNFKMDAPLNRSLLFGSKLVNYLINHAFMSNSSQLKKHYNAFAISKVVAII
jgi:hypothetical protein